MTKEQRKAELERCRVKGLMHRVDPKLIEEFGTEAEKKDCAGRGKAKPENVAVAAPKAPSAPPKGKGRK